MFDTSAAHCAAAVFQGHRSLAEVFEPMARGQAEALAPLTGKALAQAGATLGEVDAIGVGVGPGNFTGLRIAVAFARGLALSLDRPSVGISSFELMRPSDDNGGSKHELLSVEAPREKAYVQRFREGRPSSAPILIDLSVPLPDLGLSDTVRVVGFRADDIARGTGASALATVLADVPRRLGRAMARLWSVPSARLRVAPLYARAPDAAPPSDPPPVILP